MSGRPAAVFRPEIINQLRVIEVVRHFLGQSGLSNSNKECPCSMSDCIARPERELAFAVRFGLYIGDRMVWQIELHHAGGYSVITNQQVRMSLLACFLYVLGEIQPALGATQWVILQRQSNKNFDVKEERCNQTQAQCGPDYPAPCWIPGHQLPPKDHKHYNSGNQRRSDPVAFSFAVQAKKKIHDLNRQELAQEVFNPRLIAFEAPESNRGDQHANDDRRRDHPKNSAQILDELPGMNTERVLDTTPFVQCLNI